MIKRTYQEQCYSYESPDGDSYDIKIVTTADRKYIQFRPQDNPEKVITLDGEMLAEIYYAYKESMGDPVPKPKKFTLKAPRILDHRASEMPSPVDEPASTEIEETPKEWSIQKDKSELTNWQTQALERSDKPRPQYRPKGAKGTGFERIGANELI